MKGNIPPERLPPSTMSLVTYKSAYKRGAPPLQTLVWCYHVGQSLSAGPSWLYPDRESIRKQYPLLCTIFASWYVLEHSYPFSLTNINLGGGAQAQFTLSCCPLKGQEVEFLLAPWCRERQYFLWYWWLSKGFSILLGPPFPLLWCKGAGSFGGFLGLRPLAVWFLWLHQSLLWDLWKARRKPREFTAALFLGSSDL
jgi:hypothetical protein